jgi:hypothetical protein
MQQQSTYTDQRDQRTEAIAHDVRDRPREAQQQPDNAEAPDGFSTTPSGHRRPGRTRYVLITAVFLLLVAASAALLPVLFAQPARLTATAQSLGAATVGSISFESSGQLNATSSEGLNDVVRIDLRGLAPAPPGTNDFAWLLPDKAQDELQPVLLGVLQIRAGEALLTYTSPDHTNLLATYSRFLVTEQAASPKPLLPSLNPAAWRYAGSIPDLPAPGDANHYGLLDHLRHLLAKDPTLASIGLSGGLDIWLYRNAGKILEWSNAARDDWSGGQGSLALMRRQIDRVVDYLDGANYAWRDLPAGTPFLVDQKAGHIGLLESVQLQNPPGYLTHVDLHLVGLSNSPGVTAAQKQLAIKLDALLHAATLLMQRVHEDAVQLAKMSDAALLTPQALSLLNDMDTNASAAFAGQFDPTTGSVQGGITEIHGELQLLASMEVSAGAGN